MTTYSTAVQGIDADTRAALTCPICTGTLASACETVCGHAFCGLPSPLLPTSHLFSFLNRTPPAHTENCINTWLETNSEHVCPVCREPALPVHPSFALRVAVTHIFGPREPVR